MELKSIKVDVLRRSIYWVSKSFIAHCTEPFILYRSAVGAGGAAAPPPILGDQLTLFKPGVGADYAHHMVARWKKLFCKKSHHRANLNFLFLTLCAYLFKNCPSQLLSYWPGGSSASVLQ